MLNKRYKQLGILKQVYHYDLSMQYDIFAAVAVITQLAIKKDEKLFHVDHDLKA